MKKLLLCVLLAGCANKAPIEEPKQPQAEKTGTRKVQSFTMKWNEHCQCMIYITVYTYEE